MIGGVLVSRALFDGLIFDEWDQPVGSTLIGQEYFYVVDDAGFLRHIPAKEVDLQIWEELTSHLEGNEALLSEQAAKMMGQEDIFTVAMIQNQLKNKDKQFEALQQTGIPEDARAYLGMMGFRVTINLHGDVVALKQPGVIDESGE